MQVNEFKQHKSRLFAWDLDAEKDQWSISELIKRIRRLKETRLAYTSTGYLRPAKVEEREKVYNTPYYNALESTSSFLGNSFRKV